MIRIDISDRWTELSRDPVALQRFILDAYGADRFRMAAFPNTALCDAADRIIGYVKSYGYPRVTVDEGGRMWMELSDLVVSIEGQRADLREQLAALAHEQWVGWMTWLFKISRRNPGGSVTIPKASVERWDRQIATPYDQLPELEKASDRMEADKVLALFDVEP